MWGTLVNSRSPGQVVYCKETGKSKGYCFVEFEVPEVAQMLLDKPEHEIEGRKVSIRVRQRGSKIKGRRG